MKISLVSLDNFVGSLGLRSISACLKKRGHVTQMIFLIPWRRLNHNTPLPDKTLRELAGLVKDSDIIGISCMTCEAKTCVGVIDYLKSINKVVVWGGIHVTSCPDKSIQHADIICVGEGEDVFCELVEAIDKRSDYSSIKNIWCIKNGKVVKNSVRPLIGDLDSLPIPDYDFDSHYVVEEGKIVSAGPSYKSLCSICVHLARGCPHNCSYCSNSVIQELYPEQSGVIRTRGVESAIKELKYYKEIFPSLNFIWFTEDTMFSRGMKDLKLFAEEYKEKISLPFECYATAKTMNDEKLRLLLNAGLQKLEMGIQSGSENILTTVYNRNISNAQVIWASRIINNYKHEMEPPNYQIIFCNPYEKENDLMATIRLLEKLPVPFYLHVFALCMWPSSRLFKKASLDGLLSKEEKYIDFHAQHLALKINNNEVYLNYILYLIRGDVTSQKMGCLHRNVLKALTKRSLVNFVNKNANISSFVIKKLLDVEYSAIGKACSLRIQRCITFKHKVHRVLKLWKK